MGLRALANRQTRSLEELGVKHIPLDEVAKRLGMKPKDIRARVLDEGGSGWRKASHEWSDEALRQFEAALYSA